MRRISFLTIHPDFVDEYKKFGVLARCESLKLAEINSVNLRDFAVDKRGSVDASPYGGGDGMILRPELFGCPEVTLKSKTDLYFSKR